MKFIPRSKCDCYCYTLLFEKRARFYRINLYRNNVNGQKTNKAWIFLYTLLIMLVITYWYAFWKHQIVYTKF